MKILLMGTGPFAIPSAEAILESKHEVIGLVTRPVPNSSRRRKAPPNPMREFAESHQLRIWDPLNVNEETFLRELQSMNADLFVVCDYGQILSKECLGAARCGGINLHGSQLPKYRGAAPINWAIYHGETILGVSIIHMTSRLDGGPVIATASREFGIESTAIDIERELSRLGVDPVIASIAQLENWDGVSTLGTVQDPALATKAPRLNKHDGLIDWHRSAIQIQNQIRAFQPWPGSHTQIELPNRDPLRVQLLEVRLVPVDKVVEPGMISNVDKNDMTVMTGDGAIEIKRIQPAGKKPMPVADFLRGYPVEVGARLGLPMSSS